MKHHRALEVDVLRTLAILMMVTYHTVFNLRVYWSMPIDVFAGPWWWWARSTGTLFLLLVGVSAVLSGRNRNDTAERWKRGLKRGGFVLIAAYGITVASYLFDPGTFIRFGILHCIGLSMLILPLLYPVREGNILLGFAFIVVGMLLSGTHLPTESYLPFNITPIGFRSLDYYPMLPWTGVILIGMGLGSFFYLRLGWNGRPESRLARMLTWPGQHPLFVYLIHQPLLLIVLRLLLGPMSYAF